MMVFVDTVALLALWDTRDQWHEFAEAAFIRAFDEKWALVTSSCVLLECGNAAARKPYRDAVLASRQSFLDHQLLVEPTPADYENAWKAFKNRDAGGAGIVDLLSFEIMRRSHISTALTNDEHFRAAGFATLM
jgi:uncharacterized protein